MCTYRLFLLKIWNKWLIGIFLKSFIVKMKSRINMMEYTCNLGILEAEAGGLKKRLA